MTTYPKTASLPEPVSGETIPSATLAYFAARNRHKLYELVLKEFQKSKLTQAELARRLNRRPEVICRILGAPGNWGLDTVSNLLFAISGAEPEFGLSFPLKQPPRNYTQPEYLNADARPNNAKLATTNVQRLEVQYDRFVGTGTSTGGALGSIR